MFTISGPELLLIIIALAILLIWGPSKLPALARAIGQAMYEFRRASRGEAERREDKRQVESRQASSSSS